MVVWPGKAEHQLTTRNCSERNGKEQELVCYTQLLPFASLCIAGARSVTWYADKNHTKPGNPWMLAQGLCGLVIRQSGGRYPRGINSRRKKLIIAWLFNEVGIASLGLVC
uniref:Uncharacterized protein n=1 Tax=Volvariella volvacea TaxID=36659 RepID=A0A5H2Q9Z8_9AGAR|nr:hypothetical protein [Volvariella volvacea]AYD91383.1 hypothetical protein [Volvariella volvacea]AYD91414.1 hypothetical protein [Volvariella volvacea]AYD91425.1 hypothetical protein [Volvariella volvacea]